MSPAPSSQITELLIAWRDGDQTAVKRILELAYPEMHRIARARLRHERPEHTLQATALVNEAYLRLVDIRRMGWLDRAHFFAVASRVMRRILLDYARARKRIKRALEGKRVDFTESLMVSRKPDRGLTRLGDALQALEEFDARKARVVEMKYFGGLKTKEIAAVLGVSQQTVHLDWSLAKAWLIREMSRKNNGPSAVGGD
jgi:RNA polymerase sigma factor (TIGR02999 family)